MTLTAGRPATAVPASARLTLFAASFGFLMVSLDATIVNVALPTLGRALGAGLTGLQWVVDGYVLMFAAFQLVGGSLSDRLGARRAFTAGLGLFMLASLACGLAVSPGMLIAARFVQGLGAAVQLPASLAMIRHAYGDAAARTRAVGVWAAAGGAAVAAGPVLGGLLLAWLGWRSLFLVNLLVGAAGLAATSRADRVPAAGRPLDLPGQGAVLAALCGLTFALIEGGPLGWASAPVLSALAVAAVAGVAFVRWERRTPEPMVPPRLFGDPAVPAAAAAGFVQNFAYYGIVFLLSLFLQDERGESALATGLVFLPMSLAAMAANLLGGRLTARLGPRLPLAGGQLLFATGLLALLAVTPGAPLWVICTVTVLVGLGGGAAVPAMTSAVMDAVRPAYAGVGAAGLNTARQVGGAVGVALFGTLVAGGFLTGLRLSLLIAAAALALGSAATARWVGRG